MPVKQLEKDEKCKACKGAHSKHTCGRARSASRPRSKTPTAKVENRAPVGSDGDDEHDLTFKILRLIGITPRSADDLIKGRKKDAIDKSQKVLDDSGHPFGISLFHAIMKADPAPYQIKWMYLSITAILMTSILCLSEFLMYLTNTTTAITTNHNNIVISLKSLLDVYTKTLNIEEDNIIKHFYVSIGIFLVFLILHFCRISWPLKWYHKINNKYSTSCYDEMFAEPLSSIDLMPHKKGRGSRLIARMGNTLSNVSYLFTALVVCDSAWNWSANDNGNNNIYHLADKLFGINLILLSFFSTLWHSTNYNKEHYLDLWAMDHAILYLIMRYVAIGINVLLPIPVIISNYIPISISIPLNLFLFYSITFIIAYKSYISESLCDYGAGMFDKSFPPSGRRRLTLLDKNNLPDMSVGGMCLFTALPILYMTLPTLIMYNIGKTGNPLALKVLTLSLTIAWSYRMLERFCVDGLPFIERITSQLNLNEKNDLKRPNFLIKFCLRFIAGTISPTAVLHWLTGVCLLAGFVHVRSLDEDIAAM
jgi:hypothetical protein